MTLRIDNQITTKAPQTVTTIAGALAEVLGIDDTVPVAELEAAWWVCYQDLDTDKGELPARISMRMAPEPIW